MRKCSRLSDIFHRNASLVPYIVAVFLLPLLVLWRHDNVLFSPPRHTDPWFYLGFFRNLANFKRDLFPNSYYGTRLAWLLPGYFLHAVFSPVTANAMLHLAVHSVATLSLFSILQMTAGARSAFLGTMVFAVNPWLWAATGWDYVNGSAIAWCLLSMAFLTLAARQAFPKWSLLLAGAGLAGMIHSTFFTLAFAPLLPVYYIGMARGSWRQTPLVRAAISFGLWAGGGFAVVTAGLCGVNYLLEGKLWFWAPSIGAAQTLTTTFQWPKLPIWMNGQLVPWLWFTALALVTALVSFPSRLKQEFKGSNAAALLFSLDLLLAVAYLGLQQARGIPALGYYFHSSYQLPFVFLVAGISFWPAVDRMAPGVYMLTCCAAALLFAALWADPADNFATRLPARPAILLACAALAVALALRQRPAGTWLALAGLTVLTAQAGVTTPDLHGSRDEYQRTLHARARVEQFRRNGVVRFWFDEHDPANLDYYVLSNSYMAEFMQINTSFPQRGCEAQIDEGTLIVVSSSLPDAAEIARRALAGCWRPAGMKPAILAVDRMQRGAQAYSMILLRAEADSSLQHPLRVAFDSAGKPSLQFATQSAPLPFPRERWSLTPSPTDPPVMNSTSDGLIVRTPRGPYAFALQYPLLAAPVAGHYRFTLRYRHPSGQFAFGARSADDQRYLGADAVGHPIDGEREMDFWVDLKKDESVLLRIANNNNFGAGAASFVMGEVTAVEVDP